MTAGVSPWVSGAARALADPIWQPRDAPSIAAALRGDECDPDSFLDLVEDAGMREAIRSALPDAKPNPAGLRWVLRETEAAQPAATDGGGVAAPQPVGWDGLIAMTRSVDARVSAYVDAPRPRGTGMPDLDSLLGGGLYPGVNVLMAEPGAGKTALAVQLLATNALRGRRSLYFSNEMGVAQVKMRVASWRSLDDSLAARGNGTEDVLAPVPWNGTELEPGDWSWAPWALARKADPGTAEALEEACGGRPNLLPVPDVAERSRSLPPALRQRALSLVADAMGLGGDRIVSALDEVERDVFGSMAVVSDFTSCEQVCDEVRAAACDGEPPLVAVDYLQLVAPPPEAAGLGETEATRAVSRELARVAAEVSCPIVCISAKRKDSDAGMAAARGSSGIVYDAQSVMNLSVDHDEARMAVGEAAGGWVPVTLHVSKNRSGMVDDCPLWFDGRHNYFTDGEEPPLLGTLVRDGGGDGR